MSRLPKLRQAIQRQEFEALLVSQEGNRRYLSGFTGSSGWLLVTAKKALLAVDFRYVEQAKSEVTDFDIVHVNGELSNWLPTLALDLGFNRIGFEAAHIPFDTYQKLSNSLATKDPRLQLIPITGLVEKLRAIKEPSELEFIECAVNLTDAAFEYIESILRPGITEKDIAWKLESFLRERGSGPIPFDLIIASGPNSAQPHAKPSERAISQGEPVVIDIGARFNGYCCDLSRTFYLGEQDRTFSQIYDIVLDAQSKSIAFIREGIDGAKVDEKARTVIANAGYGKAFGHGLGHGIGLDAHEMPRLGPNSADVLLNGMVFTVEPGIYLPGWGGIRIEDTVVVENGRARVLSTTKKLRFIRR